MAWMIRVWTDADAGLALLPRSSTLAVALLALRDCIQRRDIQIAGLPSGLEQMGMALFISELY